MVTLLIVAMSVVLVVLVIKGSYSQSTRGTAGLGTLTDRRLLLLAGLSILYLIALAVRTLLHHGRWSDWVPAVMLLSMCGTLVVWEIRNYFLAIAGVMVGSAAATIAGWIRPSWLQAGLSMAMVIAASVWLLFRLPAVYGSLASVGDFLTSPIAQQLDAAHATVYVSCMEAPNHYSKYAADLGLDGLSFAFLSDRPTGLEPRQVGQLTYILGDSRLCPWSPISADWQTAWTSGDSDAFQLFTSRSQTPAGL